MDEEKEKQQQQKQQQKRELPLPTPPAAVATAQQQSNNNNNVAVTPIISDNPLFGLNIMKTFVASTNPWCSSDNNKPPPAPKEQARIEKKEAEVVVGGSGSGGIAAAKTNNNNNSSTKMMMISTKKKKKKKNGYNGSSCCGGVAVDDDVNDNLGDDKITVIGKAIDDDDGLRVEIAKPLQFIRTTTNDFQYHSTTRRNNSSRSSSHNNDTTTTDESSSSREESAAEAAAVSSSSAAAIITGNNGNGHNNGNNNESNNGNNNSQQNQQQQQVQPVQEDCEAVQRSLFHKAYVFLNPSTMFRFVVYLYAERKLLVLYWMHFLSTMIVWIHFFLMKFEQQKENVPENASYYYWKRLVPPLEFGSMHAILFQMALIPLTMSRYSIAALSDTNLNHYFPFNRVVRIHIYLGYVMISIVVLATVFFITFFGVLCAGGEQDFCDKFTSEIMITGYCILGILLVMGITSYLRHIIPYEIFYIVHQIVFALYGLVIVHTFDVAQRSGQKQRSQTFKWFAVSFLYYICDRLAMHFHHTYHTKILECSAVRGNSSNNNKNNNNSCCSSSSSNGGKKYDQQQSTTDKKNNKKESSSSRMLILKLKRPPLFFFRPGQYAFLKVNSIDKCNWHPFSIASGPNSPYLEFYIEIFGGEGEGSWTDKLWKLLVDGGGEEVDGEVLDGEVLDGEVLHGKVLDGGDGEPAAAEAATPSSPKSYSSSTITPGPIEFLVMGPCGTGLATTRDYSHGLAIGTGTGIVPILSLFKQHVRHLLRLAPDAHYQDLKDFQAQVNLVENAAEENLPKGSMITQIYDGCRSSCRSSSGGCCCCCTRGPPGSGAGGNSSGKNNSNNATIINTNKSSYESLRDMYRSRTDLLRDSIQTSVMYRDEQGTNLSARELRTNLKEFRMAAFQTTRSFYGVVLLGIMPVAGVGLIGFTISWNTVSVEIPFGWLEFLQACTILFQAVYAIIALLIWDANNFFAYTDTAIVSLFPFVDWYWILQYQRNGVLLPPDITTYCLLITYMTIRTWNKTVKPCTTKSWRNTGFLYVGVGASMERLDVAWVTRSSSLVSKILPDVNQLLEELIGSWGLEHAKSVCRFYVFVTDQDERAIRLLKRELAGTCLYKHGMVQFGRPDIGKIIEDHSIEMICTRKSSYSLLAYVGSPELAREIHECKLFNDMKVAITGNKKHQMEFVSESYGGVTKAKHSASVPAHDLQNQKKRIAAPVNGGDDNVGPRFPEMLSGEEGHDVLEEDDDAYESDLSNRRTISYG